ncbi:T9SS type A sorting domain-containing protein [Muricauda sp. 2012CJ35-5]|uniref:T9SS type A sorting domain-containing protein n=1 Tax=Flagellimonas spongiicola TaxID=2942208 RepID=A0ABT0PQ52_9FLAO|nr:T9SS type A sorting domain-containing protein [Allomuricauda spongiicola]MCL6273522.1 T9SS type A sorting domain-containing protein [Allomuricauda spongiicola]
MKKITLLLFSLTVCFSYAKNFDGSMEEDVVVIEILDETLEDIYYSYYNFEQPTKLVFPNLIYVENTYIADVQNLVSIEFPKLKTMGDVYLASIESLVNVKLPALEIVEKDFSFHKNPKLEIVDNPLLRHIGEDLYFHQNGKLEYYDANSLEEIVGHLYFHQNVTIKEIHFPMLLLTGDYFFINGNSQILKIEAPELRNTTKYLYLSGHTKLKVLNLCKFEAVLPHPEYDDEPKIYIQDNNEYIDANALCAIGDDAEEGQEEEEEEEPTGEEDQGEENPESNDEPEDTDEEDRTPDVDSEETRNTVSLYPNPAEDRIHLDCEVSIDRVIIYDLSGNVIKAFTSNESYDVSDIPPGIYLMMAFKKDLLVNTKKLVIK